MTVRFFITSCRSSFIVKPIVVLRVERLVRRSRYVHACSRRSSARVRFGRCVAPVPTSGYRLAAAGPHLTQPPSNFRME